MASDLPVGALRVSESNHTSARPPHLNQKNIPSNQSAGPANNPTPQYPRPSPCPSIAPMDQDLTGLSLEDGGPVAKYSPSLDADTDSTLSGNTLVNKDLKNQLDWMEWILRNDFEPNKRPLTAFALQALERDSETRGYHRDVAGWCQDGTMFVRHDSEARLTDSMLMPQKAKSYATDFTSSSYDMVPEFSPARDMDRDITGTGAAFHDTPSPPLDFDSDMEM